ncbi:hypothetical protein RN001_013163 [Aquatica leii]|uniref:Uncharacterized protein n=1 Tax=Aquatica leii TaxID=1421715 RepID=A0AAN7P2D0_9COLE|nr:hypothetical protein RN001_013163 [Aquatica leii]
MEPKETINKALRRWGGKNKNLSSLKRLKRKKEGILDSNAEVTKLTELADKVLSETGIMDIYQETYESINFKIENYEKKKCKASVKEAELDMYADDFDTKEKTKLKTTEHENLIYLFFVVSEDGPYVIIRPRHVIIN